MMNRKLFISVVVAVLVILIAGGIYWQSKKVAVSPVEKELTAEEELLDQDIAELEELEQDVSLEDLEEVKPSAKKQDKIITKESPFAVAYGETYKGKVFMPYIRELGISRTKVELYWYWIEPRNNQYNWQLVDAFLNQLKEGDEALIAVFTSSEWGAEGVGKGFPPRDYDEYYDFIYTLVKHCKGKVKYWQRDTEPASPNHWDKNKAREYVKTQEYFYKAVKAADPNALVIDVSMSGVFVKGEPQSKEFYEYVLKNAKNYFDILDIRLYWDIYEIPYKVQWFKKKMEEYGYTKPVVTTEYGGPVPQQFQEFKSVRKKYANFSDQDDKESRLKV